MRLSMIGTCSRMPCQLRLRYEEGRLRCRTAPRPDAYPCETNLGEEDMAGNIVHFEINAKDANRAKRFYTSLFGWKFKDSEIPGIEYYVIDGANPGGAINPMQQDAGPVVYFDTDDIDASIATVR